MSTNPTIVPWVRDSGINSSTALKMIDPAVKPGMTLRNVREIDSVVNTNDAPSAVNSQVRVPASNA